VLAPGRQQRDPEDFGAGLWLGVVHQFILKDKNVPARPGEFRPDRKGRHYEPM
jgi:hypothetical protein